MDRREHLERHEHDPHQHQRYNQVVAPLHRADEHAHNDGEQRGQDPRSRSTAHQATARVRSACGKIPKNFHSLRPRKRSIIGAASFQPR